MKLFSSFVAFLYIISSVFSQQNSFEKLYELRLPSPLIDINVDVNNNVFFFMTNGQFGKISDEQKVIYASFALPAATDWKISTFNPFKITLFSASLQQMYVFDRQLTLIAQYTFQMRDPLSVVKLTPENTFIAWNPATREIFEFTYPDVIIKQMKIPPNIVQDTKVTDILFLKDLILLVYPELLLQIDFTGIYSYNINSPDNRFFASNDYIVVTSTNHILFLKPSKFFESKEIKDIKLLPSDLWISNGTIAISYQNQVLIIYKLSDIY